MSTGRLDAAYALPLMLLVGLLTNRIPLVSSIRLTTAELPPPISKTIWQSWRTKDLDSRSQKNVDQLVKLNPDWQYKLLDDADADNFMKTHFPQYVYDTYAGVNSSLGAVKADLLRYGLIYIHGGAWLDLDSFCSAPLDSFVQEHSCWQSVQAVIFCEKHHPVPLLALQIAIARLRSQTLRINPFVQGFGAVWMTGPFAWSEAWKIYTDGNSTVEDFRNTILNSKCVEKCSADGPMPAYEPGDYYVINQHTDDYLVNDMLDIKYRSEFPDIAKVLDSFRNYSESWNILELSDQQMTDLSRTPPAPRSMLLLEQVQMGECPMSEA